MNLIELRSLNDERLKPLNQEERVLYWFNNCSNTITGGQAWKGLGIISLSSLICKMKKKGHEFEITRASVNNRFNEDCSICVYRLIKKEAQLNLFGE